MSRKPYHDILDSAASDSLVHHTDLWPNISARLERKSPMMTLRTRPLVAMLIAFLILLALSGVVYALGRSLGYMPGIGIVDQSVPIRVLAEPVSVRKQDISVTVSEVVADLTRTFLSYRVEGLPLGENGIPTCAMLPDAHLPDGTGLENRTGSGGTGALKTGNTISYGAEAVFSPIPVGTNDVTFVLDCVLADGSVMQKFELPLRLVPAPEGYATPAVEIAVTPDGAENETGLHLENVLELEDSYVLIGKFTDAGDLPGPLSISTDSDLEYLPHIEDTDGNPVSFEVRQDIRPEPEWNVAYYWAYEIPKPVAAPLTITVDRVNIWKRNTAQFAFDAGDDPQVGQEWSLNQAVRLGPSEFVVESVTFLGNGYTFLLSSENLPAGVTPNMDLEDRSSSPYQFDNVDSRVDNSGNKARITLTLTTNSPPPTGNLMVTWWLDEDIPQPGPWSLVWTPAKNNP
jgi:hypothetical protein